MKSAPEHNSQSAIIRSTACQIEHIVSTFSRDNDYCDDEIRIVLTSLGQAKQALMDALDARAKRRRAS